MNPLVKQFGNEKRWVTWKLLKMKGKLTKIPYQTNGRKASSTDPESWSTYDEAKEASDNIGIVFTPDQKLLGIDIDHCLKDNKIHHEQKEKIAELILEADTYTEISPSGEGLHLFLFIIDGPFKLEGNKKAPYELYTTRRYFTVTENPYGEDRPVRNITIKEAEKILAIIGYPWAKEPLSTSENPIVNQPISLDDSKVLEKMLSSKNGQKIRELLDGALSIKDKSSADMALCSYLAFWTGRNAEQMERLWMDSKLGRRDKTTGRKDYRNRTIRNAIKNCKEIYETQGMRTEKDNKIFDLDLLYVLDSKGNKVFTQNTENMCRILRRHPEFKNRLRFDAFKNIIQVFEKEKWRLMEDNDEIGFQTQISILFPYFGKVGKQMVYDAMVKVAKENEIDSALDYIKSLTWDKTARLNLWLTKAYGTEDNLYHRAVGSNWLKGLAKRIVEPGCKFDYVLVLEGPQGAKKSMSLNVLAGDWYMESTTSTETKDFFMQFAGNLIIEFSEGDTMSRTEVKRMKAIITTQTDKYRPSYGRAVIEVPRRCVFAMTTNDEEYLKDDTGNRRWMPVKLEFEEANIEWLKTNRDQLFAEAYHRVVNLKETVYEFPKEETKIEQDKRKIHYEHEEEIIQWYFEKLTEEQRANGISVDQVYRDALGNAFGKMHNKYDEMRIAGVLRDILKLEKRQTTFNSVRTRRYFNPLKPIRTEITVDDFDI